MSDEIVFECDGYGVTTDDLQQAIFEAMCTMGEKLETVEPELSAQLLGIFNCGDEDDITKLLQRSAVLFRAYYRHDGKHFFVDVDSFIESNIAGLKSMISSLCVSPE